MQGRALHDLRKAQREPKGTPKLFRSSHLQRPYDPHRTAEQSYVDDHVDHGESDPRCFLRNVSCNDRRRVARLRSYAYSSHVRIVRVRDPADDRQCPQSDGGTKCDHYATMTFLWI